MHENELLREIVNSATEVHRVLGPGLLEIVYEEALCHELHLRGIAFSRQKLVPLDYKGVHLKHNLYLDLLIDNRVVVAVIAKKALSATDKPQILTALRLCDLRIGLIINFHVPALKDGIIRIINSYLNPVEPPTVPPDFRSRAVSS